MMIIIFTFILYAILALSILILILALRILLGKDVLNKEYSPVKGSLYLVLFHLDKLYDFFMKFAVKEPTFRFLTWDHSEIYTTHPPNVEYILKTRFDSYTRGSFNYDIMSVLFGDGIFTVDGEKWRHQRKLASHEFSTGILKNFSCAVFRRKAASLAEKISCFEQSGDVIELRDLLAKIAMDNMCEVALGIPLTTLEGLTDKETAEFVRAFDESNALTYRRYLDFAWKIKRLLNVGTEAKLKRNSEFMDSFVYKLIKSKRRQLFTEPLSQTIKKDILSRFLLESVKDPKMMTDNYLKDIILNFVIAGKDTVGGTLAWFIYMLCKHPLVQAKVVQEVEDVVGKCEEGQYMKFAESITEEALEKLNYLHSVLTETLRLYPAVPIAGKSASRDDVLPDGFKVRKGDGVNYLTYVMGRMTYIWGDDAEEFRPERWLQNGIFQPESPFKFLSFNAGPRICLGKDFAYRQMKIVTSVLLSFFTFKLDDPNQEVNYQTMFTLHMYPGLFVRLCPRHH